MIRVAVVMLSERPNVRVHNDPLRMCPAREPFRARNAGGGFSLVRFFVPHKEMNTKCFFRNLLGGYSATLQQVPAFQNSECCFHGRVRILRQWL